MIQHGNEHEGAGLYVDREVDAKIENCVFTKNNASYGGGGLYVNQYAVATFANCSIIDNTAVSGGGAYIQWYGATANFINCVFVGNTSSNDGGAACICRFNTKGSFINCTIAGNSANRGTGIFFAGTQDGEYVLEDHVVQNSIIAFNSGEEVFGNYVADSSLIGQDPGFVVAPIFQDGKLVNLDQIDLRIADATSPAVNAGDNSVVTTETDIVGAARINGDVVDLGAYEYQLIISNALLDDFHAIPIFNGQAEPSRPVAPLYGEREHMKVACQICDDLALPYAVADYKVETNSDAKPTRSEAALLDSAFEELGDESLEENWFAF